MSGSTISMSPRRGYLGVVLIFCLMTVTLYMAFAFPYTLFNLKQTETTEIKSVILIGLSGERSPRPESYFIGEEPPESLHLIGHDQLTNVSRNPSSNISLLVDNQLTVNNLPFEPQKIGKERMYLLGKFLRLRYYHLLLNGDPRKIYARSADIDRCLESAQALLAGLNPARDQWTWSPAGELDGWQPIAVHTRDFMHDDLLSVGPICPRLDQHKQRWKNSTRYQQLLNEFRHDLQTLRSNTGLEFEDDLEMLSDIEESLKVRKAFRDSVPVWYTNTFANRLAHIADVTTESRFSSVEVQRLFVGRLLHEMMENINAKVRIDQQVESISMEENTSEDDTDVKAEKQLPEQPGPRIRNEPNIFLYLTDKQRLSALLNSLQIYSSQPYFGSLLIVELHYDPINKSHFLRLFTVSSTSVNSFPEPLRVNPIACADSIECAVQQFEQNIRHLMLDTLSWSEACSDRLLPPLVPPPTSTPTNIPVNESLSQPAQPTTTQSPKSTTATPLPDSGRPTEAQSGHLAELDENLIVGPTNLLPPGVSGLQEESSGNSTEQDKLIENTIITTNPTLEVALNNLTTAPIIEPVATVTLPSEIQTSQPSPSSPTIEPNVVNSDEQNDRMIHLHFDGSEALLNDESRIFDQEQQDIGAL